MLKLNLFDEEFDNVLENKITKYVNSNISNCIRLIIDYMEDDSNFKVEHFIRKANSRIFNVDWKKLVYELYDIVKSPVIRDYIMPNYEFLLYEILEFCEDAHNEICLFDELDSSFKNEIKEYMGNNKSLIYRITTYSEYYEFLFYDYDFFPEDVERMTMICIKNRAMFNIFYPDVNLDEYKDLMPEDLYVKYNNIEKNLDLKISKKINIPFLQHIYNACIKLQANDFYKDKKVNSKYKNVIEDVRNDYIRDLLKTSNYYVQDQTRQGQSEKKKSSGEVDIKVEFSEMELTIVEAMNLYSVDKNYITKHINKVFKYDTLGNKENYILSYVRVVKFKEFWDKYKEMVINFSYDGNITMEGYDDMEAYNKPNLRCIKIILLNEGIMTNLTHIVVKM